MELQLLNSIAGGGSVAILAVIIFIFYRNDKNEELRRWQEQNVKTETIARELIQCRNDENRTRSELTKALTELTDAVKNSKRY